MTDLPRRSYPLVVTPPGGFEDAVRRGRRRRRKQTGGSSAAVLVLVGALAYSLVGHSGDGTDTLDPANGQHVDRSVTVSEGVTPPPTSPSPSATAVTTSTGTHTVASGPRATGPRPSASAPQAAPPPVAHPSRPPGGTHTTARRYAARPPIRRLAEQAGAETSCLQSQTQQWCTTLLVTPSSGPQQEFETTYTVCRPAAAGKGTLSFKRLQEVEFAAVDTAHNDTVWTYSAGQPILPDDETLDVTAGYCVSWEMTWNGYDDFGYTPPAGAYTMTARSITVESLPQATYDFDHA